MERRKGVIVRGGYSDYGNITPAQVQNQFVTLIESLANLHKLNLVTVGLNLFGRPEGYRQRQVDGWRRRLEDASTADMAEFTAVSSWLARNIPDRAQSAAVIHNDFKMDNLVWDPADITHLTAVLDWEMATVGDPFMDLACTLSFWIEASDPEEFRSIRGMPTAGWGVLSRREAAALYGRQIGQVCDPLEFYLCFGFFRRAVIEQQKYYRYTHGHTTDNRFANLNQSVRVLRDMCLKVMSGAL
jgi:aminoglycoside phosphotransferase (APT) family kinase protein